MSSVILPFDFDDVCFTILVWNPTLHFKALARPNAAPRGLQLKSVVLFLIMLAYGKIRTKQKHYFNIVLSIKE